MPLPRHFVHAVCALVVLGCTCAVAETGLPEVNALVIKACSRILDQVRDTRYDHTTHVVPEEGVYHLDCSGFLCHFLGRFSPDALAVVPIEARFRRQRAVTFHTAFSSAPVQSKSHWKNVPRLEDALPGDFYAWRKVVIPREGNSGHCGIIWERPVRESDGTVRVRILDSTTTGHKDDRRADPKVTGLALGTMWFIVDKKGGPIGYHWVRRSDPPTMCPVAVARLTTFGAWDQQSVVRDQAEEKAAKP